MLLINEQSPATWIETAGLDLKKCAGGLVRWYLREYEKVKNN